MIKQFNNRMNISKLCEWVDLSKSVFYYKSKSNKPGIKPSVYTMKKDGTQNENQIVVNDIKNILSREFVCYGYHKVCVELKNLNYIINAKKVYRLMNENNLLLGKVIKTSGKREWVKHRKIEALKPMEYLCIDIKYIWVEGDKKHYYLLSVIDVYTRKILAWILQSSVRKMDVINLFRKINIQYNIKGVYIRSDNGSQFIANDVRQFLKSAEANQEFTHVATPEENSYIEAYHSILQAEVINRYEFASYYDAKITIAAYVDFYNKKRIHSGIDYKTPQQMWNDYYQNNINFALSGEAEAGNAGEQPTRNSLTDEDSSEGACSFAPSPSFSKLSTSFMPKKTQIYEN
jgi:putative transposase